MEVQKVHIYIYIIWNFGFICFFIAPCCAMYTNAVCLQERMRWRTWRPSDWQAHGFLSCQRINHSAPFTCKPPWKICDRQVNFRWTNGPFQINISNKHPISLYWLVNMGSKYWGVVIPNTIRQYKSSMLSNTANLKLSLDCLAQPTCPLACPVGLQAAFLWTMNHEHSKYGCKAGILDFPKFSETKGRPLLRICHMYPYVNINHHDFPLHTKKIQNGCGIDPSESIFFTQPTCSFTCHLRPVAKLQ